MRIPQSVIDHIVQRVRSPGTVDESLQSGRLSKATFNDNRLKTHHAREHFQLSSACVLVSSYGKNKNKYSNGKFSVSID
jgi:hypothetical protein